MPTDPAAYVCQGCGAEVGKLFALGDGVALLDAGGGVLLRYASGVCKQCGAAVHFSVSEQMLLRLVRRVADGGIDD